MKQIINNKYKMTKILLVNPPIYDFAAYDLWAKPLGLLYLSSILKQQNIEVQFFDYMDRNYPGITKQESNKYGCGHYLQQEIEKPKVIKNIRRKYHRYGIPSDIAKKFFQNIEKPDIIIIGSIMTYWYLGVIEVSSLLKKIFPDYKYISLDDGSICARRACLISEEFKYGICINLFS